MNTQQQTTWSGRCYLSSHSCWKRPGIKLTLALLPKKCSISNDLDGTEDDILWDERHDKSDSEEEGDDMYDDTQTDTTDVQWR